jgi:hypothetical protein
MMSMCQVVALAVKLAVMTGIVYLIHYQLPQVEESTPVVDGGLYGSCEPIEKL